MTNSEVLVCTGGIITPSHLFSSRTKNKVRVNSLIKDIKAIVKKRRSV
jgi:hypothetical protein